MSSLTEYRAWLRTALDCCDGKSPRPEMGRCQPRQPLQFPLAGILSAHEIHQLHQLQFMQVQAMNLRKERVELYRQFIRKVYWAYRSASRRRGRPKSGTIRDLRRPLEHLSSALQLLADSRDLDDKHPVRGSEIWGEKPVYWLDFKTESLRPALVLLLQLFRLILPDCEATWTECLKVMGIRQWKLTFTIDSPTSRAGYLQACPPTREELMEKLRARKRLV